MKNSLGHKKKLIFIVTGEQSGDSNCALVIKDLLKLNPDITIIGIGGNELADAGMELLYNYSEVNYIGLSSVILNFKKIIYILNKCVNFIKVNNPDLVILVDFPSFNLKFAEKIRKFYKGKILYYISPQIWAWKMKRVNKVKKYIDRMMVIYPFEVDFYKQFGINAVYVGNPLLNKTESFLRSNIKKPRDRKLITLLPGSRDEEFRRNLFSLIEPVKRLKDLFNCDINLLLSPNINVEKYRKLIEEIEIEIKEFSENKKYNLILNSDLVITKFGTSSTECALLETPFITIYKANPLNYIIAKSLVKVKYATLINIISDSLIVKEFIQKDLTTENICNEAYKILSDEDYRKQMINKFKEIKKTLKEVPINKSPAEIINEYLPKN